MVEDKIKLLAMSEENIKNQTNSQYPSVMENLLDTVKYILGNELHNSINNALAKYLDELAKLSIDYSHIQDNEVRACFENLDQIMIEAKARNDFAEFCRCASLKIESVLEYFYNQKKDDYKKFIENKRKKYTTDYSKYSKYEHWYDFFEKNKNSKMNYWNIVNLLKIRDSASHRKFGAKNITENIKKNNNNPQPIINFYNKRDFYLVKDNTERFVKTTLIYLETITVRNNSR